MIEGLTPEQIEAALRDPLLKVRYHRGQNAAMESLARIKAIKGGNRCGKTEFGSIEHVAAGLGYRPWLSPKHPLYLKKFKPPVKIRIFGEDLKKGIGQIIIPKMQKFIPKLMYAGDRKDSNTGTIIHIDLVNGTTYDFLSYDMDPDAMEGWDGHYAWFDEPPPRSVWIATWRGLTDHEGEAMFTATPLKEPWFIAEIDSRADRFSEFFEEDRLSKDTIYKREDGTESGIESFTWDTTVNIGVGLTRKAVEDFASQLTPEEKECRLHGKPMHYSGRVFKEFDRGVHVVRGELDPSQAYTFYESVDPHPRTRHAYSFYAVDENNNVFKYDEIWAQQGPEACSAKQLVQMVLARRKGDPVWTKADPWVFTEALQEESFADKVYRYSNGRIQFEPGSKNRDAATLALHEVLKVRNSTSVFHIMSNCTQSIWEYENWVYDEKRGRALDRHDQGNKGIDKDDHFIETDGRAVLGGMRFRPNYAYVNGQPLVETEDYEDAEPVETGGKRNKITGY